MERKTKQYNDESIKVSQVPDPPMINQESQEKKGTGLKEIPNTRYDCIHFSWILGLAKKKRNWIWKILQYSHIVLVRTHKVQRHPQSDFHMTLKWKRANKTETGNRAIWLVYRTDSNARGFCLVKRTLGWKSFMPENFLEINRYFALTSYCNTIGHIRVFFAGK